MRSGRGLFSGVVFAFLIAALAGGGFWLLGERKEEARAEAAKEGQAEAPARVSTAMGETTVKLDAAAQERGGIVVAPLEAAPYRAEQRAYATILEVKGLNELASAYANAQAQRQSAEAKLTASRTAFTRTQSLYKDQQNVSAAQLQSAEAAFRADEAALAAATTQTGALAATARQEWGETIGDAIIGGDPMARDLIERANLLVQVTLPPGRTLAQPPAEAAVETPQGGRVALRYVSPATRADPRIQGLSFFYIAPATSGLLPGMNLVALLPAGPAEEGELVPDSAVVRWQGKAWVYLRTAGDSFVRREVSVDVPAANGGYVVASLPADAEIVMQGAQVLLTEELRPQLRGGDED